MYRVYILANQKSQRYIGLTDDVERRLQQHNEGASKWTKGKGLWSLSWVSGPMSLSEARKLESKLKRQKGGEGLQSILQAHNPAAAGS